MTAGAQPFGRSGSWQAKARAWRDYAIFGLRQVRQHGLRLLWARYVTARRILSATPVPCPATSNIEVHMQICARDWRNGLWTLWSLGKWIDEPFRSVLFTDGSVPQSAIDSYKRLFPGIVTPSLEELDRAIEAQLPPNTQRLRALWKSRRYFTLPKLLGSWVSARQHRWICVDPDVLFLDKPTELVEFTRSSQGMPFLWNVPVYRGHSDGMFCFTPEQIRSVSQLDVPVPFAVGCGAVDRSGFAWDIAEDVLRRLAVPDSARFMLDQTLFALFAGAKGFSALPRNRYAIEPVASLSGIVARHYYAKTRNLFYSEGVGALATIVK